MSPHAKLERLLRETGVPIGLLDNGVELRLVYAPRGETSGHVTFPVRAMTKVDGRPILAALHMLLEADRLFTLPKAQRLPALLAESRKYQNLVSTELADQVLGALWELLRGFQAADEAVQGRLIDHTAREDPEHIYGGLLTVIMRLVFLLYAEDQDLMPKDRVYVRNYSVTGLYQRLREDAGRHRDTMDQRFGAWASLLGLFRLVFDGGQHGELRLPARRGQLFDPDEYPFLEGRAYGVRRVVGDRIVPPALADGVVYRVLRSLLVVKGERISYRSLDVEQIGSVYEAMMGFEIERAFGRSIGVRRRKKGMDLDIVFNVEELIEVEGRNRKKWLKDRAECELTGKSAAALANAVTPEEVVAALGRRVSRRTKGLLPAGSLYLQPGEERRRSGSHYTPRELTEPIVGTTLRPVLEGLGERPRPEQILDLKVCDPAMGSGAFLVEACRQLAEKLVEAWNRHEATPEIPPDEDRLLHARRLVAQRCLYGVDKNPFAVNLAKLSLWLATLARDHAFTFLDHALKCGDSLVGLTREQIRFFRWKVPKKDDLGPIFDVAPAVAEARRHRAEIQSLGDNNDHEKRRQYRLAEEALVDARLVGNLAIAAFFGSDTVKAREDRRRELHAAVGLWRDGQGSRTELEGLVAELQTGERPVIPFHWELEFPEVFERPNPGFDFFVGNPPFLGGTKLEPVFGRRWRTFAVNYIANGKTGVRGAGDLCAYFLLRAFALTRIGGGFGLVATNSVSQGDTRRIGLAQTVSLGGTIHAATTSRTWPGAASIEIAEVWVIKGGYGDRYFLDGTEISGITPFLGLSAEGKEPLRLSSNADLAFEGAKLLGSGFILKQAEAEHLLASDEDYAKVVWPFLSGADVSTRPDSTPSRWTINFWDWPLNRDSAPVGYEGPLASDFPRCLRLVEERVRPERLAKPPDSGWNRAVRERWWQYGLWRPALYAAIHDLKRVLVRSVVSNTHCLAFRSVNTIFANTTIVFAFEHWPAFTVLQSGLHEAWLRRYSSTMRKDIRYTPSSCFQTFPFPDRWQAEQTIDRVGRTYYEFRADLMIRNNEGLTKTYNRFHNPDERDPDILKLRDLHEQMDRAVLDAYGWHDVPTACDFFLDYEIDEETWGKKKKPWRYRWPDDVHDDVLARLLDLNQKQAEEERLAGLTPGKKTRKKPAKRRRKAPEASAGDRNLELFPKQPSRGEDN